MLITVFTPTYNRAHLLPRLYDSLCKQTFKDFEWLIVDDGSVDDTTSVVDQLIIDNGQLIIGCSDEGNSAEQNENQLSIINCQLSIRYLYQKNGGKHRAINRGVKEARGELFFIVDSDDSLTENALELIAAYYSHIKDDNTVAGLGFMRCNEFGVKIGSPLDFETLKCNAFELTYQHHASGDMAEVFRTEILKDIPFPEYDGEKFCPEALVWFRIADRYNMLWVNKCIYICKYLEGGLTSKIVRIRMDSPHTAALLYAEQLQRNIPLKVKLKSALSYWRFAFCNKKISFGKKIREISLEYALLFPIGYMIHLHDKLRY